MSRSFSESEPKHVKQCKAMYPIHETQQLNAIDVSPFTDHAQPLGFGLCTDLGSLWWIPQQGDHTVHSSLASQMYVIVSTQLHDMRCVYTYIIYLWAYVIPVSGLLPPPPPPQLMTPPPCDDPHLEIIPASKQLLATIRTSPN